MANCVSMRIDGKQKVYDYVLITKKNLQDGDVIKLVYGCDKNGLLYKEGKIIHIWRCKPIFEYIKKKITVDPNGYGEITSITEQERKDFNYVTPDEILSGEQASIEWYANEILITSDNMAKTQNKKEMRELSKNLGTYKDILLQSLITMLQKYGKIF